jgi:mycoredoxin-dependent peroxiredoxin
MTREKEALNMKTLGAIRAASAILFAAVLSVPSGTEALEVGDKAPDFELPATTGGTIRLSDYVGKMMVLVEFYHADWGPTCTANLMERRDDLEKFQALGVQVLGISLDHAYSQASFAQSLGLQFPLLSDFPHGRTVREYGIDYYEGEAKRLYARPSFFLIDKDGVVRGYWGQRPRNPDEVLAPDPLFSSGPIFEVAQAIVQ